MTSMNTTTPIPGGVTNADPGTALGTYVGPDPTKVHQYFEDFDYYVAGDWTLTVVGTTPTEALTDVDGGVLLVTLSNADNDHVYAQKVGESFLMEAGKQAWFKTRFKTVEATQVDLQFGLINTDTTPIATSHPTDGIFFRKDDGDAYIDVYCRKDATTGSTGATAIATLLDNTYTTLGWYYDGVSTLTYFVDDVPLGHLDASSTYLPNTELTVSWLIQAGEATNVKTLSLDYLFAAKER